MKKPVFLDLKYLQWTQSIFTTNISTDCIQKKMHCAQLQPDKKEFVSKCQSFQYFLALFTRIHFFCYEKNWNGKRYSFANVIFFCHMRGQIQSKPIYVKQFWLNLLYLHVKKFSKSNGKTISHLHFDFCHNRRNGFSTSTNINDKFVAS